MEIEAMIEEEIERLLRWEAIELMIAEELVALGEEEESA